MDLYRPPQQDPLAADPPCYYYAGEGLASLGAGYGLWREEPLAQSALGKRLVPD